MFLENAAKRLGQAGFKLEKQEHSGVVSFAKKEETGVYIINLVNLGDTQEINTDRLRNIIYLMSIQQKQKYGVMPQILNIYVTSYPNNCKEVCCDDEMIHWIIDTVSAKLIIYENQSENFFNAKKIFEDILNGKDDVQKKPIPYITYSIVGINILVFAIMYMLLSPPVITWVYENGGLCWVTFIENREFYRIITYMFLHVDIQHIFNNMFLLFFTGAYVEQYLGKGEMIIIYFVSGILAGAGSMGYNMLLNNNVLGIGASGAIFGITGAIVAILLLLKDRIEEITPFRLGVFIFLSLLSGFEQKGIDNMAHLAGLVSGFVITVLLIVVDKRKKLSAKAI